MKMEPIVSSETSAIRTQTPGKYPKRNNLQIIIIIIIIIIILHSPAYEDGTDSEFRNVGN